MNLKRFFLKRAINDWVNRLSHRERRYCEKSKAIKAIASSPMGGAGCRLVIECLYIVIDRDGKGSGDAGYVPADHQDNAELAQRNERMSELNRRGYRGARGKGNFPKSLPCDRPKHQEASISFRSMLENGSKERFEQQMVRLPNQGADQDAREAKGKRRAVIFS